MVASLPWVAYGQLFYKLCDNFKSKALKLHCGYYSAKVSLPLECKQDLNWWTDHILAEIRPLLIPKPYIVLKSDAWNTEWSRCIEGQEEQSMGGNWSTEENQEHINYLEMVAVRFTILAYCKDAINSHIKLLLDKTTTAAYINNFGGTKQKCNSIAKRLWIWMRKTTGLRGPRGKVYRRFHYRLGRYGILCLPTLQPCRVCITKNRRRYGPGHNCTTLLANPLELVSINTNWHSKHTRLIGGCVL